MSGGSKLLWMVLGALAVLVLICGGCGILLAIATSSLGNVNLTANTASSPSVGIVLVDGVIVSGKPTNSLFSDQGIAYSGIVVKHLKQAEADPNIKAVVLRVNSPGGSVVGSQEIHQQLEAMHKPVVVSMGELAASGGYYIAAPADEIYANPATLTGSIGVISQFIDISQLLKEYGIEVTTIKSGEFKDEGSLFRPMTEEEKALWKDVVDEAYQGFVQVVANGRKEKLSESKVRQLADGRVYTGKQAKELGLVDELGNLPDAIRRAGELGGIVGEPNVLEYREPRSWLESMLGLFSPADPLNKIAALFNQPHGLALQYLYLGR